MNTSPGMWGVCLALLLFVLASPLAAESTAATALGEVTVTVASGRTFTAEVDARTDTQTLWLRWGRGSMVIQQPIAWDRVAEVSVGGRRVTAAEFAHSLLTKTAPSTATSASDLGRTIVMGSWADIRTTDATLPPPRPAVPSDMPARVQSLAIDARLANWNSTAETDGLRIEVAPLDAAGFLTPVRGTLEVELIGSESTNFRPGRVFPVIGRWVHQVEIDDFTSRGASYPLAFQQVRPEVDPAFSPFGTLRARLTVAGQGVLEATATIRIRSASLVRGR